MTIDICNSEQQQQQNMCCPCRPLRRRRRSLAFASVVVLASAAATCSAFTTTSNVQQHTSSSQEVQQLLPSHERRSLCSVLNMVSFLEAPSSTLSRQQKLGRKDLSGKRLVSAKISTPSEARTIEIDISDYDTFRCFVVVGRSIFLFL